MTAVPGPKPEVVDQFRKVVYQFYERLGWVGWRFESCSEWLAWRCDISLSAAREKVRVAHAILHLPNIA